MSIFCVKIDTARFRAFKTSDEKAELNQRRVTTGDFFEGNWRGSLKLDRRQKMNG